MGEKSVSLGFGFSNAFIKWDVEKVLVYFFDIDILTLTCISCQVILLKKEEANAKIQ